MVSQRFCYQCFRKIIAHTLIPDFSKRYDFFGTFWGFFSADILFGAKPTRRNEIRGGDRPQGLPLSLMLAEAETMPTEPAASGVLMTDDTGRMCVEVAGVEKEMTSIAPEQKDSWTTVERNKKPRGEPAQRSSPLAATATKTFA